ALSTSADDGAEMPVRHEEQVPLAMVMGLRSDCSTPIRATRACWPLHARGVAGPVRVAWLHSSGSGSLAVFWPVWIELSPSPAVE
ncbi:MAG TPA: hypothetical protein VMJ65_15005, partial [Solirubrobacteraceae bacterium]|nr:hypothetical protein [Solirubrobacteraceae bacterium]